MESKYAGYMGKVMLVDLSAQTVTEYPWTDAQRERYLGGKIMAAGILCDHLTGRETAFGEENWVVISTGPLTGTGAPSSARFNISALSPQTGLLASSSCSGSFGIHLKKAGFDALILKGKCQGRKWLEIDGERFVFHDAQDLWGTKISQCQETLARLLDRKNFGSLCIGPAGENLVKYAAVISGERAAGRTGMGAVLGWKGLKAITVSGNRTVPVYNREKAAEWCGKWTACLRDHPLFSAGSRHGLAEELSAEQLAEEYGITNKGCLGCPISCARTASVQGRQVKGPELEALERLGAKLCSRDLRKLLDWNRALYELGMDTISAADAVVWAIEAKEKGLWDNGLECARAEALTGLLDDIAHRRGIGDALAEGKSALSRTYGGKELTRSGRSRGSAGFGRDGGYRAVLEGVGLNPDFRTPRAGANLAMLLQDLMEAVSASGQCLFTAYAVIPGFLLTRPDGIAAKIVKAVIPHMGWAVCFFNQYPRVAALHLPGFHHTRMIELSTGMRMDFGKYLQIGERGSAVERYINCKFGLSAAIDKLPKRLAKASRDPKTGIPPEIMKKIYYAVRGWDENGVPTESTLRRLKIQ